MNNNWSVSAIGRRLTERCDALAVFSESTDALTRVYLSKQHRAAHQQVAQWMIGAGMRIWHDAVGNVCGRYEGVRAGAPALLLGSHLDTVRNAGKYDGMLGVITAIELVARLHENNQRLPFAIEVVGFADEEGTRFGSTLLGSRGLTGQWQDDWLKLCDVNGVSLAQALEQFGLPVSAISRAARSAQDFIGYLEVHIEQGPQLEAAQLAVGVVTAINGAKRLNFTINGQAGHAGTVPMAQRQDALVAASELVLAIETIARARNVVATVGQISCKPGAVNVICAQVHMSLDIRAADDRQRDQALTDILARAAQISEKRRVQISEACFYQSDATPCDVTLQHYLQSACDKVQGQSLSLASGAGHDAMAIAQLCPVGMLFVRCAGGISHHPGEAVLSDDLGLAFLVLDDAVRQLAESPISG
ncbi:allantoate amidohydrolase [Celerinatantimonas yamalensis]|uniref:Allantoate amidohydrolase n=1 Tax=Celerinatantimonas yamalensis TaxID=559956 RepID=A0ABW9GAW4_9GAMM